MRARPVCVCVCHTSRVFIFFFRNTKMRSIIFFNFIVWQTVPTHRRRQSCRRCQRYTHITQNSFQDYVRRSEEDLKQIQHNRCFHFLTLNFHMHRPQKTVNKRPKQRKKKWYSIRMMINVTWQAPHFCSISCLLRPHLGETMVCLSLSEQQEKHAREWNWTFWMICGVHIVSEHTLTHSHKHRSHQSNAGRQNRKLFGWHSLHI